VRFLDKQECEGFGAKVGFDRRNLRADTRAKTMKRVASFVYRSRMKGTAAVATRLVEYTGNFSRALLWAYGLPLGGDRSREEKPPDDWRRYAQWRRSAGEDRTLFDAPGHLVAPDEKTTLAEAIEFAVDLGWDAVVLMRPLRCIIALSHDDIITVQSRHNVTALADALGRLGLSETAW
jgi:hypothetical protein